VAILEPWVLLRLIAGLISAALFVRASVTSARVLRFFNLARASEGQLALERRLELARTFVRVGAAVQIAQLALTALAADKLSHSIRGAMCAYGVFAASPWGFRALAATVAAAIGAGLVLQLFSLEARVRDLSVARPLAIATLLLTPLSLIDFALTASFLLGLDLGAVASCCSTEIDAGIGAVTGYAEGPRLIATVGALGTVTVAAAAAWFASRRPGAPRIVLSGALSVLALPLAIAAAVLEVAPYAFEAPHHTCPFCLLHADVLGIGYPLFAGMFVAAVSTVGAALGALVARSEAGKIAVASGSPVALRRGAIAWAIVVMVGAAPIVRYAIATHGAPLFR
jgi:hypothetical protein